MKVLVTGGCGFLGSNLARALLRRGDEVLIYDNLYRAGSEKNLEWLRSEGKFGYVQADVRDFARLDEAVKSFRPDAVFHFAGQVAMTSSIRDPRADFEINALGTFNVLEAVRAGAPAAALLYSSTNKVYGDLSWAEYEESPARFTAKGYPAGFPENIPVEFHSPYGCSKGAADQYALDFHRIYGLRTAVFRHSSMYGGRQFPTFDQGWIGWFVTKAVEAAAGAPKEPFTISGTGKQVRDVLHAEDMISLYLKAADNIDRIKGQAFNVGGGMANSLSLLELFALLEGELGVKLAYARLPERESDQKVFVADTSKIRRLLDWRPEVDKVSGIRKMISWIKNGK